MENSTIKKLTDMFKSIKQKAENKGMTKHEAIEQMDNMMAHARDMLKNEDADDVWQKDIEALAIGKASTIKQIGLTPAVKINEKSVVFVEYEDGHGESKEKIEDIYCCPRCLKRLTKLLRIAGRYVPSHKAKYCGNCGQKIDWSK